MTTTTSNFNSDGGSRQSFRFRNRIPSALQAAVNPLGGESSSNKFDENDAESALPTSSKHEKWPGASLPPLLVAYQTHPRAALWSVALPTTAIGLVRTLYGVVDAYWVSKLGTDAFAAVSGCSFAYWMVLLLLDVPAIGAQCATSQNEGAGARQGIWTAAVQGTYAACAISFVLVLAAPHVHIYAHMLGLADTTAVHARAVEYLYATLVSSPLLALSAVPAAAFRGLGDMRFALVVTAISGVINAALDPVLIWGVPSLGIPAMGVAGAAYATSISALIAGILLIVRLRSVTAATNQSPLLPLPNVRQILQFVVVGLPLSFSGILFSLAYVLLGRLCASLGTVHLAALGLGHRIESLAYHVTEGYGVASSSLVGQWLGAGKRAEAYSAYLLARTTLLRIMIPLAILMSFVTPQIAGAFASDPVTADSCRRYLLTNVWVWPFMALEGVADGAFTACGATTRSLIVSVSSNVLRIGGAYLAVHTLPVGKGASAADYVWLAIALSCAIRGFVKKVLFERYFQAGGGEAKMVTA